MTERGASDRTLVGLPFAKMTGSGNDFVFFDAREVPMSRVTQPEVIRAICNRHNGIGADGIVILEPLSAPSSARIHYYNSDGTSADLCGNATLCSTTMSVAMGLVAAGATLRLHTEAGEIRSRVVDDQPQITLPSVSDTRADVDIELVSGERRIGFTVAGIPHLVLLCDDADAVDVATRGPELRHHPILGAAGANVNWVSSRPDGTWRYRTFERGVEGETLACGTGAVATGTLLATWGMAVSPVRIHSSSGRHLEVSLEAVCSAESGAPDWWLPTLRGEGRIVFRGRIATLFGT